MTDAIDMHDLAEAPDADMIAELREKAEEQGNTVGVTFPTPDATRKRFVASPRGTCVLLNDTREETYNRTVEADEIASALRK